MAAYRNDVDALAARHDALAAEVAQKTRELDTAKNLLEEAQARAKLPVLPNIRVASPCTADWNAMTGDERVRACGSCNKNVYNLSDMTRAEAEALIAERNGRLCVRYYQRKDGTILLADCSIGIAQKRKRRVIAAGAAALLAGGGALAFKLLRPEPSPPAAYPTVHCVEATNDPRTSETQVEHAPPHVQTPDERPHAKLGQVMVDDPDAHAIMGDFSE